MFVMHTVIFLLRKKLFNEVKDFIHFNVSLSLLLSSVIFIIGNGIMDDSSVSILIHNLSSFYG